ncbi:hypothetical protein SAMN06265371_104376 [Lutibacter agarilyticus]|uniref:Lipocalin-like domain-containing protein n=1 Tax=Lutibacter agarilyticus TaxID=1109740 RepID=A0A238X4D0_9FLAO|nr:hypothetical protein [Lutibacter agarilyticus]SNR53443.1 hypothetical protein SAMN06265371_104376 [Lutibacter agarilyticus]
MKKFILLIIAMFLISCSDNDDDNNSIESDKIIGEWYLYKDIDLEDNSVELYELSDSDIEKITFSSNGILLISFSEEGLNISFDGTWVNSGSDNYKLTLGEETITLKFTFISNDEMKTNDGDYESYYKRI